jgi:choline dehydrogenase-like flavoprotein
MMRAGCVLRCGVIAPRAEVKVAEVVSTMDYQYIVVGGGASGCLVAGRLAQENYKTLVLEAGPDVTAKARRSSWQRLAAAASHVHRAAGRYIRRRNANIGDKTVELEVPMVVGGAGVVLGPKTYIRGHALDWTSGAFPMRFDDNGLVTYYKRLENGEDPPIHRGKGGRFLLSKGKSVSRLYKPMLEGLQRAGFGLLNAFNGPSGFQLSGAGRAEALIDGINGNACSSANQYLSFAKELKRPLTIRGGAVVDRLVVSEGTATGVVVKKADGTEETLHASRGVVLTAGALSTPQILLRTPGLPESVVTALEKATLWAVPCETLRFRVNVPQSLAPATNPLVQLWTLFEWRWRQTGWLAASYDDMVCFVESSVSRKRRGPVDDVAIAPYPDIKITVQPFITDAAGALLADHGVQFKVQLLRPTARGRVEADGAIRIQPSAEDEEAIAEVCDKVRAMTKALSPAIVIPNGELEAHRTYQGPYGGTCPLGPAVDVETMKLNGVSNLIVCDGSVVPNPLVADMVPLAYALSELAVERTIRKAPAIK